MWKQSNNQTDMSEGGFTCGWTSSSTMHLDEISSVCMHPTGDYLVTTSLDGTWSFLDISREGECLKQVDLNDRVSESAMNDEKYSLVTAKFHPDGLILATSTLSTSTNMQNDNNGTISTSSHTLSDFYNSDTKSLISSTLNDKFSYTNSLKVWDIREQKNVATFLEHKDIIGVSNMFVYNICTKSYI